MCLIGAGKYVQFSYMSHPKLGNNQTGEPGYSNYHNCLKFSDRQVWVNSVDPDQTVPRGEELFDLGLHCLPFRVHLLDSLNYDGAIFFKFNDNYGKFLSVWIFRNFTVNHDDDDDNDNELFTAVNHFICGCSLFCDFVNIDFFCGDLNLQCFMFSNVNTVYGNVLWEFLQDRICKFQQN